MPPSFSLPFPAFDTRCVSMFLPGIRHFSVGALSSSAAGFAFGDDGFAFEDGVLVFGDLGFPCFFPFGEAAASAFFFRDARFS